MWQRETFIKITCYSLWDSMSNVSYVECHTVLSVCTVLCSAVMGSNLEVSNTGKYDNHTAGNSKYAKTKRDCDSFSHKSSPLPHCAAVISLSESKRVKLCFGNYC